MIPPNIIIDSTIKPPRRKVDFCLLFWGLLLLYFVSIISLIIFTNDTVKISTKFELRLDTTAGVLRFYPNEYAAKFLANTNLEFNITNFSIQKR